MFLRYFIDNILFFLLQADRIGLQASINLLEVHRNYSRPPRLLQYSKNKSAIPSPRLPKRPCYVQSPLASLFCLGKMHYNLRLKIAPSLVGMPAAEATCTARSCI
uniref:Putative secreted protein n=1 Tax=Ixodes ricinus TaxID=34613 RepID=A0A6B0U8G5_IXORI